MQPRQQARMRMHGQLHPVVADITGATGMKIVRALVAGPYEPAVWAASRAIRCHASVETMTEA
jgi:transposase